MDSGPRVNRSNLSVPFCFVADVIWWCRGLNPESCICQQALHHWATPCPQIFKVKWGSLCLRVPYWEEDTEGRKMSSPLAGPGDGAQCGYWAHGRRLKWSLPAHCLWLARRLALRCPRIKLIDGCFVPRRGVLAQCQGSHQRSLSSKGFEKWLRWKNGLCSIINYNDGLYLWGILMTEGVLSSLWILTRPSRNREKIILSIQYFWISSLPALAVRG